MGEADSHNSVCYFSCIDLYSIHTHTLALGLFPCGTIKGYCVQLMAYTLVCLVGFLYPLIFFFLLYFSCERYISGTDKPKRTDPENWFFWFLFFKTRFSTLCRRCVNLETRQISSAKKSLFELSLWTFDAVVLIATHTGQPIRSLQSICVRVRHWLESRASVVVSHLNSFPLFGRTTTNNVDDEEINYRPRPLGCVVGNDGRRHRRLESAGKNFHFSFLFQL